MAQRAEQNGRWRAVAGLPQIGQRRGPAGSGVTGSPEAVLVMPADIVSQRRDVKRICIATRRDGDRDPATEADFERAQRGRGGAAQ